MKKLLLYIFLVLIFCEKSYADQVLFCSMNTHVKYSDKETWENLEKRKWTVTIKSKSLKIFNHKIELDSEYIIISQNELYLNAFADYSNKSDGAWVEFFSLNKKTNEAKLASTTSYGETYHIGKCRKN